MPDVGAKLHTVRINTKSNWGEYHWNHGRKAGVYPAQTVVSHSEKEIGWTRSLFFIYFFLIVLDCINFIFFLLFTHCKHFPSLCLTRVLSFASLNWQMASVRTLFVHTKLRKRSVNVWNRLTIPNVKPVSSRVSLISRLRQEHAVHWKCVAVVGQPVGKKLTAAFWRVKVQWR